MSDTAQQLSKEQKRAKALRENLLRRKPIVKSKTNEYKKASGEETECIVIHEHSKVHNTSVIHTVEDNYNNNQEQENTDDSIG